MTIYRQEKLFPWMISEVDWGGQLSYEQAQETDIFLSVRTGMSQEWSRRVQITSMVWNYSWASLASTEMKISLGRDRRLGLGC